MKNTFLITVLATVLNFAVGNAKADIVYSTFDTQANAALSYSALLYVPTADVVFAKSPHNLPVGYLGLDGNGNGVRFSNYRPALNLGFIIPEQPAYIGITTTYYFNITSTILVLGDTVSASNSYAGFSKVLPDTNIETTKQYIGFENHYGADTYYGWASFKVSQAGVFTLDEAAINSVAGESITVGAGAIPEPSTYAAIFGVFALGFCAYRRNKVRA